ncbi:MAG TPA: (d)CMP kinase, partial [Fimbriimonas sp.]|nr:(d)CMP kinase [Fimbriimonas sp.]
MSRGIVIAIDGPAGAGKSTVSKMLARELDLRYLDTGAMYRALALKASRQGIDLSDGDAISRLMAGTRIEFGSGDPQPVILDGEDLTGQIRTLEVGEMASKISTLPAVRAALVHRQQEMCREGNVVLEGRDATTVIAPDADVKVYLTASLEERAKRRTLELGDAPTAQFENVRNQIVMRDHRDITREDSPLKVAEGAMLIESGGLTPEEVVERIKSQAS